MDHETFKKYSAHFGDVPLKSAMIGWTAIFQKRIGVPGRIIIIPKAYQKFDWFRYFGLTNSVGACFANWKDMSSQERLLNLYLEAWHIIARDGVAPEDVHAALMVIPEYRESLSGETFFRWINKESPPTQ